MPLQQTSGNVTSDAYGGGTAVTPVYIEDVMSTFLYTGNGSTQTITNNIDLSGKGGLVWCKSRGSAFDGSHFLNDTARGVQNYLRTNATSAQQNRTDIGGLTAFNSNGFSLAYNSTGQIINENNITYASWTFRKQPKFFDVVTWTADSSGTGQAVPHNLGSIPGCIIVKATNASSNWFTWHIATDITVARTGFQLNSTAASALSVNSTGQMTSTEFFSGQLFDSSYNRPVTDGTTYVAYLFAHNAGGFGLTGTDNVISCGSFTVGGSGAGQVNLGYEAQWVLTKNLAAGGAWNIVDTMRGLTVDTGYEQLLANSSGAAYNWTTPYLSVNNQGFGYSGQTSGDTWIYIAIRRGPMKVPTDGTKVLALSLVDAGTNISVGFPSDLWIGNNRDGTGGNNAHTFSPRLTGTTWLQSATTAAQFTGGAWYWDRQNNFMQENFGGSRAEYLLGRAPSFMDVVCFNGTSSPVKHNLGVTPELGIQIYRNTVADRIVVLQNGYMFLNQTAAFESAAGFGGFTSTTFSSTDSSSSNSLICYLFATCAGVSKVGSYTGNGTTQTINCGFTGGARFVLIKRTDSTGDWYVYDTARGMTTLTDPYLLLNSTAAESATLGSVTTVSTGFAVNASILAAINTNGASYIYLSIA